MGMFKGSSLETEESFIVHGGNLRLKEKEGEKKRDGKKEELT
jgi:hypothetical protein